MPKKWTLMHGMARARCAWEEHMKQISSSAGIPDSYRPIIMFLHHNPGASQRSVADFLNVTTSAINQVVKNMLLEELVYKEADPADGRSYKLYLSPKGEDIALRLRELTAKSEEAITAFVGAEREQELTIFIHQLTDFIKKELE